MLISLKKSPTTLTIIFLTGQYNVQVLEEEGICQNCMKDVAKKAVFIRISLSAFDCE